MTVGDDLTVTDDLIVNSGATIAGTCAVGGNLTADSGIYTSEHQCYFPLFTGPGPDVGHWNGQSFAAAQRLYRLRDGKAVKISINADSTSGTDLILELQKVDSGASVTTIGTLTLDGADTHDGATYTASYDQGDYLRCRLSVDGGGTVTGVNVQVNVELVE
jgi:hypothetical protein